MAVDTVADGEEALSMALTASYDVIVLDVMLPSRDGFAVARSLREKRVHSQILMLTGRGAVEDRVHGLDVGADDYLVKPFALKELQARLRALPFAIRCKDCEEARENAQIRERQLSSRRSTMSTFLDMSS